MAESSNWAFPKNLQPSPKDVDFDLDAGLNSVVLLRAEIPEDAFTASILGTERAGYGVVIRDDGLILTIGYLIVEADEVTIVPKRRATWTRVTLSMKATAARWLAMISPKVTWTRSRASSITVLRA